MILPVLAAGFTSPGGAGEGETDATVAPWLSSTRVYEAAEPSLGRSVILVHGFGGSPYDLKPLADALRESGLRVVVPVVPGEASAYSRAEAERVSAGEVVLWLRRLIDEETGRRGKRPFLVGFSMGGTLATIAAAGGETVERLVLVSPFYSLPYANDLLETLGRKVAAVMPVVPKPWKGRINDPEGYDRYLPGIDEVSIGAFLRLEELAGEAVAALEADPPLPPTLVLASPDDSVASFRATESLFGSRPGSRLVAFPGSNHILFFDYAAGEAIEEVRSFLLGAGKDDGR